MGSALPEALLQMAIVRRILDGIHQGNLLLSGIYDGKGQDGVSHVEICSSIVNAVGRANKSSYVCYIKSFYCSNYNGFVCT